MFTGIIITRVLFITCLVFILGYVFGNFSAYPVLKNISRIAAVLLVVLFIAGNIFMFRFARQNHQAINGKYQCGWWQRDTANAK
jgi:EamA domain-containing membrane protein RarD